MKFKPIRNQDDRDGAETILAALIEANKDGTKDDDIDVLSTLIEQYEKRTIQIEAPTPVAAIRFRMEQQGLCPRDLEPFIGSRARVSEILSERRGLSIDMIRALHDGLGIPYEALIGKKNAPKSIKDQVSQPVLNRLRSLGYKVTFDCVDEFVASAFQKQWTPALRRKTRTPRANTKTDEAAQLLWQAAVLTRAASQKAKGEFSKKTVTEDFLRKVAQLSTQEDGPRRAVEFLSKHGIIVVFVSVLPGTYLDGAAMLSPRGEPVIGLTLRHDKVDNFWFTLLHELAHITRHLDDLVRDGFAFFDDLDMDADDQREEEADQLAQDSLIPRRCFEDVQWGEFSSNDDINALAERARVHISIPAGRWQREHQDYRKFSRLIERNTIRAMFCNS